MTKLLRYLRNGFLLLFFSFLLLDTLMPLRVNLNYSSLVLSEEGRPLAAYLSSEDKWRLYLEEKEITTTLKEAFLLKEDRFFYFHPGFNPVSLFRALFQNMSGGKRISGASTITMQVVRLLQPRARTYGNKAVEIIKALQLEWHFSKDEILRLYLNLVPYGGNVEGIKSASFLYFQCLPEQLSPAQIATLAVVPNRPNSWRLQPDNEALKEARNRWLQFFYDKNWIDEAVLDAALEEDLQIERKVWEPVAPHLCRRLFTQYRTPIIQSHIRYSAQRKCEEITKNYSERIKGVHITNASVIVIDNRTRKVIAYSGSADFMDKDNQGEVDGVLAIRSPGSTLKPFIYGLAIEKGIITPKTIVYDVPCNFSGYTPENYDKQFNGALSVQAALSRSLNIPAVGVLHEYGVPEFITRLNELGLRQIGKDKTKLGLSMILGGCGVSLESLSNGFATLACNGTYTPLRYVEQDSGLLSYSWIKPEASFLISEILCTVARPDLPSAWQMGKSVPRIAWKTGTSYGRRDAWSIGYNDDYTIGVWVGNFNNEGVPDLNGAEMATPLLFQLFEAIQGRGKTHWLFPPKELSLRKICTETGQVPGENCIHFGTDYYLPGISKHQNCGCRKEFQLSNDLKISYCKTCVPDEGWVGKVFPVYPPGLIRYFEDKKISYENIPPHNPLCTRIFQESGPRIVTPTDQSEYLIEKEEVSQLSLVAEVDARVKEMYWYVNDRYMGIGKIGESFIARVPSGRVKISCTDDQGRTSHIYVKVTHF